MCALTKAKASSDVENQTADKKSIKDAEETKRKEDAKKLVEKIKNEFFDASKPWVLVPNGSFMGAFDWVPEHFRVGSWSILVTLYFGFIWCLILYFGAWYYSEPLQEEKQHYFPAFTPPWFYNLFVFFWTSYVSINVYSSPMGGYSWASFTLQSWTILSLRHGLCALVPFLPFLSQLNESLRFPSLVMATVTFTVWNFVIMPIMLIGVSKSPEKRMDMLKFFFSFNMVQLHVCNIVFAAINGIWGSPTRELQWTDFYVGMTICVLYCTFYLFVLDRVGAHFYPIFSPRTLLPMVTYTAIIGIYYASFKMWRNYIQVYGS